MTSGKFRNVQRRILKVAEAGPFRLRDVCDDLEAFQRDVVLFDVAQTIYRLQRQGKVERISEHGTDSVWRAAGDTRTEVPDRVAL